MKRSAVTRVKAIAAVIVGGAAMALAVSPALYAAPSPYVALGDSVAAGDGLPLAPNASQEDALCRRSPQSYPYLVSAQLGYPVTNLACSGAKTSAGIRSPQTIVSGTQSYAVPSQLDRAFLGGAPQLITMTVGANDLSRSSGGTDTSWRAILDRCYTSQCGTFADSAAVSVQITALRGRLALTLRDIKARSGSQTPPKVLITEYYYPVSATACFGGQLSLSEAQWVNTQVYKLNTAIRQTVIAANALTSLSRQPSPFAAYVPVNFNGHGLCSPDPWIQGLTDAAPVHPTAVGQTVYAQALVSAVRQ